MTPGPVTTADIVGTPAPRKTVVSAPFAGPNDQRENFAERLRALRAPFSPNQIGKLPRGNVTLDFVGHAAVTDRLLAVDPFWTWEPLAFTDEGLPFIRSRDNYAVLWIKLTACGVTRLGVGVVEAAGRPREIEKELISDAIRNAAMRFGVALDLWSKEDLTSGEGAGAGHSPTTSPESEQGDGPSGNDEGSLPLAPPARPAQLQRLRKRIEVLGVGDAAVAQAISTLYGVDLIRELTKSQAEDFLDRLTDEDSREVRRLRELTNG